VRVGLQAAAYGMIKFDSRITACSSTHTILLRAVAIVERKRIQAGPFASARVFESIEEHNMAALILSRFQSAGTARSEDVISYTDALRCRQAGEANASEE
jgi:hypothetical protein